MYYKVFNNSKLPKLLSIFIKIHAITIGPWIFCKDEISESTLRHELVHVAQWKECLYIGFLPIYIMDWVKGILNKKSSRDAYLDIRMEREARLANYDEKYLQQRKDFAWRHLDDGDERGSGV